MIASASTNEMIARTSIKLSSLCSAGGKQGRHCARLGLDPLRYRLHPNGHPNCLVECGDRTGVVSDFRSGLQHVGKIALDGTRSGERASQIGHGNRNDHKRDHNQRRDPYCEIERGHLIPSCAFRAECSESSVASTCVSPPAICCRPPLIFGAAAGRCEVSRSMARKPSRSLASSESPALPIASRALTMRVKAHATTPRNSRTTNAVAIIGKVYTFDSSASAL